MQDSTNVSTDLGAGSSSYLFTPSFAQQRMWLLDQLEPASARYNIVTALSLRGRLNLAALEAALNQVVARHESLRTVFEYENGVLQQCCLESLEIALEVLDGADLSSAEFLLQQYRQTFNLQAAPLLRCRVLQCAPEEYVLALTMHHIISDAWSSEILARELALCYRAQLTQTALELPELSIQYADFAEWQREQAASGQDEASLAYWRQQLQGVSPLALPLDKARPARMSYRGATQYFDLPRATTDALAAQARAQGNTLFVQLLTAFYVLLYRYTGQTDLVVGAPVSGRGRLELENLIGLFVNTIALRVDVQPQASFSQLAQQVRQVVLDGQAQQNVGFERVLQALNVERDLSHTPIFQVMFAYQEASAEHWQFEGMQVERVNVAADTAKFDLTLSLENLNGQLRCALEYSSDLFKPETMQRFSEHFTQLLAQIAASDIQQVRLNEYEFLSQAERRQLLSCWDQPLAHYPVSACLHQAFEQQAARTPDAIALRVGEQSISYASLNARANQLARYLRSALEQSGTEPAGADENRHALIGICLPREDDLVVAILAVLKAGCGYLPIDPALSPERIAFYVTDSKLSLVLTNAEFSPLFGPAESALVSTVCVDSERAFMLAMAQDNLDLPCSPQQLAYVIYTSGSTGTPKGVLVPHSNVMRLFHATDAWFGFGAQDVWTLFHSSAFDFSVWEIWGALLYGGRLVVVPYMVSRSPQAFYDLVQSEKVTVLNQTPSAFKLFSAVDAAMPQNADKLALRYVIFGGEALEPSSLRTWMQRYGDAAPQLINMYGITETTVHVSYRRITRADAQNHGASPIGVAIPDLRLFILDANLKLAPIGVTGEIYVAGSGVAEGYLRRPELTQERFIAWPPALQQAAGWHPAARLYKTGDLARFLPDGSIEYQGRADDQVKIRGFRIELGEIEAALRQVEEVREVCLSTLRDQGAARIVAYIVAQPGATPQIEHLRASLKRTLPEYMIPAHFVFLDALPLTNNGKIDRKALPAPANLRPHMASEFVAPRNPQEQLLADVWRQVLGLSEVGVLDNFFALGGDSLRGVQAIGQARALGLNLALVDLFAHQTIAGLASQAAQNLPARVKAAQQPFSLISAEDRAQLPASAIDAYPLSRMQGAMFYHMQLAPESNVYHCTGTSHIGLKSPFNEAAFRQAVQETVARHDVLRTSFELSGFNQALQVVHADAVLPLEVEDLRGMDTAAQEQRIKDLLEQERNSPFDLSKPTLLRFFIQLRSELSLQFTMTECHPVFDGWSYHTMIVEVFNRYAGITGDGDFVEPPALQVNYRDFVEMELAAVADPAHQQYWADKLADCTILRLPRLQPQNDAAHSTAPCLKAVRIHLPEEVYAGLQALMHAASVPMKSVLLAGHIKVMSLVSGERDILTGIPSNGRPEEVGGDALYGLFLNTLPFRFILQHGASWRDTVQAVFANECEAMPYRRFPLAEIQRQFGRQALLDEVLFNYMDFHVYEKLDSKLGFTVVDTLDSGEVNEGTNFALNVHFQHLTLSSQLKRKQISIQIDYDASQLTRQQIDEMAEYYQAVFSAMASSPQAPHHAQDFLPPATRQTLLQDWSGASRTAPHQGARSLAALFAEQVAKHAQATALTDGERSYSYAQLNQAANQLARHLQSRGLRAGQHVALCLARSPEMIIAILAIVKAQAVYVPIDVEDPLQRIAGIVQDSACQLIISQERYASYFPAQQGLLLLERISTELAALPADDLPLVPSEQEPKAYIMYTSGSTGAPKGALIPQAGIVRLVKQAGFVDFEKNGRVLQLSSVSFDASTLEIWGALLNGGCLILYPNSLPSIPVLENLIAQQKVETAFLTTTLLNTVVDEKPQILAPLRHLISGGEAMSPAHARKLLQAAPGLRLTNGYGPTENTTFSTTYEVSLADTEQSGGISIGRAIAQTQTYVLDAFMNPAPIGTPGQLYVSGAGLAFGYLQREELTAAAFVANPFDASGQAPRLYRTGDLVCYHSDGNLHYLGRIDGQVKMRGFRIELGEIESALCRHPAVKQAAVRVLEIAGGKKIIAWVVAQESLGADTTALKIFLSQQLPKYMLPNQLILLPEMPLTRNGKLDSKRLPAPAALTAAQPAGAAMQPASVIELDIAQVWQQVLQLAQPSLDDNFFDLGGHSLSLARVHQQLRARGYAELAIVDLLNYPTIRSLAQHVQESRQNAGASANQAEINAQSEQKRLDGRRRLAQLQQQKQRA
ncbi:amino acid adenylation domain-containing protein [Massilia sp. W12]|uniref:amino acid adenylation domain-containing protein n=1 Tax=Massilia sp. W12 TaxID=3126507 RepID=UPI0030CA72CF